MGENKSTVFYVH